MGALAESIPSQHKPSYLVTYSLEPHDNYEVCCRCHGRLCRRVGDPHTTYDQFEMVCRGRCILRQRLMRLAAAVGSIMALLVAGGARWKY
jgi:hypothetical protein